VGAAGFPPRRENLSVISAHRRDEAYDMLVKASDPLWAKGFNRKEVLKGKPGLGAPKTVDQLSLASVQQVALLMAALEGESELTSITHDASRQLLYAAGLLPPNVAAPEWLLFGMGSFFETPPESPWSGLGAPSFYYLPRFRELANGKQKDAYAALRGVITDEYFRHIGPDETPESAQRKALTMAWSLTYFLAQQKLDGLQRYFKEVGKMPRDIELDGDVLLGCFARAFDAVDRNRNIDENKLRDLASRWYNYAQRVPLESEDFLKQLREYYKEMNAQTQQAASNPNGNSPGAITSPGMPNPANQGPRPNPNPNANRQPRPNYGLPGVSRSVNPNQLPVRNQGNPRMPNNGRRFP